MKRFVLLLAVVLTLGFAAEASAHFGHGGGTVVAVGGGCGGAVGVGAVGYGGCGVAYAQPVAVAVAAPVYAAPVYAAPVFVAQPFAVATPYAAVGVGVDNRRTVVRQRTVVRTR